MEWQNSIIEKHSWDIIFFVFKVYIYFISCIRAQIRCLLMDCFGERINLLWTRYTLFSEFAGFRLLSGIEIWRNCQYLPNDQIAPSFARKGRIISKGMKN